MKYCRALNYIFTEDYVYWAEDWFDDAGHYLFKCPRNADGIIDFENVIDYCHIPDVGSHLSTYTTCYMEEINAVLLLEHADSSGAHEFPVRVIDLNDATIHTVCTMEYVNDGNYNIGFRTRYSEVYPVDCTEYVGFDIHSQVHSSYVNMMKGFGNTGYRLGDGTQNINNMSMKIYRKNNGFGIKFNTLYI